MKLFSAEQLYQADQHTLQQQCISSEALMERAATQLFTWIDAKYQSAPVAIHLFCGIGNNGGDGLALARLLCEQGYPLAVYIVSYGVTPSGDFRINVERLQERGVVPDYLTEKSAFPALSTTDVVVDAIFGIGLNRPPEAWVARLIAHINAAAAFVISVDMPSGLPVDRAPWAGAVVQASQVLTFHAPKLPFFLPQTGPYVAQWEVLDIGLDAAFLHNTDTAYTLVDKAAALALYRPRSRFSHKGTYGHAVLVGGSYGKIGAVHLASKACLAAGSGLVTALVPQCGYLPLQTAVPELMVVTDAAEKHLTAMVLPFAPKAIGVGIGMGTHEQTAKAFGAFLTAVQSPLVVDADGLNLLAQHPELLTQLPPQSILTPHPKELERLLGKWEDDFEMLAKAQAFADRYNAILVLKGAYTVTLYRGKGYVNSTGNPGMATAGSGDVLTGMLTGLLAQGYTPLHAAVFGVYLHGLAGDRGTATVGCEALTASGIVNNIGKAYQAFLAPSS